MNNELIYVYCISNTPVILDSVLVHEGLKCVFFQEYYVVVKNVSPDEFSEENLKKKFADLSWIDINARGHIEVISQIMKSCTVIPFKFGTIFKSEESLGKFISDYSDSLKENLINIEGKEEWSVKIYFDRKVLNEQIAELSEEVRNLEQQISESSQGKGFILKKKKNEIIEKEVEKVIKSCGQTCYDECKNISELSRTNNLLPNELTERNDDMILNVSFFIKKQRVVDFVNAVDLLQGKFNNIGFDIDVSGPWPPFSFVTVKEHFCNN
ncbi:MAG: GvpL/GvpF family gas vesicle protein [Bacteroidales bacterium]